MGYILIAEDDRDIMLLIERKLSMSGYEAIWTTDNGQAALDKALDERPLLLILDVMMPKLDGLSICKQVKATYTDDPPPVIIISARGQKVHFEEGLAAGADAYVVKPFAPRDLLEEVDRLLGHYP